MEDKEKVDEKVDEKVKGEQSSSEPQKSEAPRERKVESPTESWKPRTEFGRKVKSQEITEIDQLLETGQPIREAEIIDVLLPDLQTELLLIGQSKGKFGGGQRRVFRQTQKKTREGNKPKFSTGAVVGNADGYVGFGTGKSKETVPAREKAFRNAKLSMIKVRRGCGSWQCTCGEPHSIPFEVRGKCGSSEIILKPAPKGTGLCVENECGKILKLAGIKDVWSKTLGQTKTKLNLVKACMEALSHLMTTKVQPKYAEPLGMKEGSVADSSAEVEIVENDN